MKHWKTLQNGINLLILLCLAVLILCPLFMIFARAAQRLKGRPEKGMRKVALESEA